MKKWAWDLLAFFFILLTIVPPLHTVIYSHEGAVLWDSRDPLVLGKR